MHKDISPEERLLSIIRGDKNKNNDKDAPKTVDSKTEISAVRNKINGYVSIILKNSLLKDSLFDPDILRVFNKYMVIALALFAIFFVLNALFISPSRKAASVILRVTGSRVNMPLENKQTPIDTKNYSYYSNKIVGKNIFRGSSYSQAESQETIGASAEAGGSNLGLVGIVPGDNPQAIIEDKKNQKTYYLIKGQSLDDIIAEDVSSDKVVLEYKGKKITLLL